MSGGRTCQAEEMASTKALRTEHVWYICGLAGRPLCAMSEGEGGRTEVREEWGEGTGHAVGPGQPF